MYFNSPLEDEHPIQIRASIEDAIRPETAMALADLPMISAADPWRIFGVVRPFEISKKDGRVELEDKEPPLFLCRDEISRLRVPTFRSIAQQKYASIAQQKDVAMAAVAHAAMQADVILQGLYPKRFPPAVIAVRDAVVVFNLNVTGMSPMMDKCFFMGSRSEVSVSLPTGLSNHRLLQALENAADLISLAWRDDLSGPGVQRGEKPVSVTL
jgi:hypothetical protein